MDIVVLGYAGALGVSQILEKKKELLETRYHKRYLEKVIQKHRQLLYPRPEAKQYFATEVIEAGEAGLLACLYRIATEKKCGLKIEIRKIPLLQGGIEVCEFFGCNIYRLRSQCFVLLCESGYQTVAALKVDGFTAEVVGMLDQTSLDKCIVDKDELEYINRPGADEIYRILDGKENKE